MNKNFPWALPKVDTAWGTSRGPQMRDNLMKWDDTHSVSYQAGPP